MASSNYSFASLKSIDDVIGRLRNVLSAHSTRDACSWIASGWLASGTDPLYMSREMGFASQQRQTYYILGLLMTTPEPSSPQALSEARLEEIVALVNEVEVRYFDPLIHGKVPTTLKGGAVAFGAFVQFFMSGRLSYPEQLERRIRDLHTQFDDVLNAAIGISATDTLRAIDYIKDAIQREFGEVGQAIRLLKSAQEQALISNKNKRLTLEELRSHFETPQTQAAAQRFNDYVPLSFTRTGFHDALGAVADNFLSAFCLTRGSVREIPYYASKSRNAAEDSPLFRIDDEIICCPFKTAIYETLEGRLSRVLAASQDIATRFSDLRSSYLERRSLELIKSLFPTDAQAIGSYFETPNSQNEHDGFIFYNGILVLIEAKSSDMVEPSRDPARSFERISQHFRSNRGIQHGFDQGARVERLLRAADAPVMFYDRRGNAIATIDPASVREIYIICTTMESFGPLAVNLTYLLQKDPQQHYPLAINLFDLETLIDALLYRSRDYRDFLRYADQRRQRMGQVTADDELDLAGVFMMQGELPTPIPGKIVAVPGGSTYFDDIYFEKMGVERTGNTSMGGMAVRTLERLAKRRSELGPSARTAKKVGRNARCPCGSGKKFKKCHGSA